jgi:hypothetical protein
MDLRDIDAKISFIGQLREWMDDQV